MHGERAQFRDKYHMSDGGYAHRIWKSGGPPAKASHHPRAHKILTRRAVRRTEKTKLKGLEV